MGPFIRVECFIEAVQIRYIILEAYVDHLLGLPTVEGIGASCLSIYCSLERQNSDSAS